jgi:hypothetical protein
MRRIAVPIAAGSMALSGLAFASPAAADTLSYPYKVSSSTSWGVELSTPNAVTLTPGTDDGLGTVALPFAVNIFGHQYAQGFAATASSNGTLQFGSSSMAWANTSLPTASFSGPTLLPFWDDFDVTPTTWGEGVYWGVNGTAPNRTFTVKWRGYLHNSDPKTRVAFMVDMFEWTPGVRFSYLRQVSDPMADGSTATVGIQEGGAAGQFAQFSYNQSTLSTGLGIYFEPAVPTNTAYPQITGSPVAGQTLSTTTGTWAPPGAMTYSYQWERCVDVACGTWANISGATGATYTLQAADVGKKVFVAVKASNGWGPATGWAFAYPVGPVTTTVAKPVNVTAPVLTGTPEVGSTVSVTNGTWTGSPTSYAYEWWRCIPSGGGGCVPSKIDGAVSNTYVLTAVELTGTVYVKVTATNGGGSASAVSNAVGPVTDPGAVEPPPVEPPPGDGDEEGEDGEDAEEGDEARDGRVTKPSLTTTGKPSVHKKGKKLVVSAGLRGLCPKGRKSCSLSLVGTAKIRKSVVTVGQATVTVQPGSAADAAFVMRSKGKAALRKKGRLSVKLVATLQSPGSDQVTSTRTFKLKKPAWLQ